MTKCLLLLISTCSLCLLGGCGTSTTRSSIAPVIANAVPPAGTTGAAYTGFNFTVASGGQAPFTWRVVAGTLPAGLSLDKNSGAISGTPTSTGVSSFTVQVTDSNMPPMSSTKEESLTINAPPLTITSGAPPSGQVGLLYDGHNDPIFGFTHGFPLTARGGVGPYEWSWGGSQVSPIPGLNICANSFSCSRIGGSVYTLAIVGTPTTAGTYNVVITVTDSETPPAQTNANYTIVIVSAATATINSAPLSPQQQEATHHRYKVVDLGTLGGPNSFHAGGAQTLNNQGTFAAYANTSASNPNPGCFVPFNNPDCFVERPVVVSNGSVTELDVLPGGTNSQTDSISASGRIDGWSENGLIDPLTGLPEGRAVLWTKDGKIIDLGTVPGGNESLATAVNSRGQVVGFSNNDVPDPFSLTGLPTQTRAFLWQNGVMQDLGTLGGTDGLPFFINERGQITGFSFTNSDATLDPFFWQNSTITDIGSLGGTFGQPNWLNRRGQVVGTSNLAGDATHHGFLWDRGTLTDLGTLGGDNSEADWISDSGLVVGRADPVSGSPTHHGFLWRHGVMNDLGVIDGDACSTALSVNSRGQVVGDAGVCGVGGRAWLWENGGPMVDLNDLALPGSGLHLQDANQINDRGEIVCTGVLPNGDQHAVLLVPVDGVANANSGAVATQSAAPRYVPSATQRQAQSRWSNRYHVPGQQSSSR